MPAANAFGAAVVNIATAGCSARVGVVGQGVLLVQVAPLGCVQRVRGVVKHIGGRVGELALAAAEDLPALTLGKHIVRGALGCLGIEHRAAGPTVDPLAFRCAGGGWGAVVSRVAEGAAHCWDCVISDASSEVGTLPDMRINCVGGHLNSVRVVIGILADEDFARSRLGDIGSPGVSFIDLRSAQAVIHVGAARLAAVGGAQHGKRFISHHLQRSAITKPLGLQTSDEGVSHLCCRHRVNGGLGTPIIGDQALSGGPMHGGRDGLVRLSIWHVARPGHT